VTGTGSARGSAGPGTGAAAGLAFAAPVSRVTHSMPLQPWSPWALTGLARSPAGFRAAGDMPIADRLIAGGLVVGRLCAPRLRAVTGVPAMQPFPGDAALCMRKIPAVIAHTSMALAGQGTRAGYLTGSQRTPQG
jgi:hypothetical protein